MVNLHTEHPLTPYAERELLHRYGLATADYRRRGREWYAEMRRECERIAEDTGIAFERVAAVAAITSPDAQLSTNVRWTEELCHEKARTRTVSRGGRYPEDQRPKARRALDRRRKSDPGENATGPKVNAFYRAIRGDEDVLVVDRWAAFAAGSDRDKVPGAKARKAIADAYRRAAEFTGETVRDFQAIVWIQARETTERADGKIHKLADITA